MKYTIFAVNPDGSKEFKGTVEAPSLQEAIDKYRYEYQDPSDTRTYTAEERDFGPSSR